MTRARDSDHRQKPRQSRALEAINADSEVPVESRPSKYLNDYGEQDHGAIK
jgi:hypothetical protein